MKSVVLTQRKLKKALCNSLNAPTRIKILRSIEKFIGHVTVKNKNKGNCVTKKKISASQTIKRLDDTVHQTHKNPVSRAAESIGFSSELTPTPESVF